MRKKELEILTDMVEILTNLVKRFETVGRRQEVGVVMQHLMVLQLDGRVEISKETMRFYLDALGGTIDQADAFRKHCVAEYFS